MWAKKLRVLVNKMVGSSHTLIAIRMVRSKLRKREETNNNSLGHGPRPAPQLSQLAAQTASDGSKVSYAQSHPGNGVSTPATVVVTTTTISSNGTSVASTPIAVPAPASPESTASSGDSAASGDEEEKVAPLELFLWSSYPSSQQLSPYSETQDTLVRSLPCEAPQDSKGLRKNPRGKWKRLVKKKPDDSCGIPPELRDQLKQIYVY